MNVGYELLERESGRFRVWDEPVPGRLYVCGIDVAENRVRDRMLTRGRQTVQTEKPDYSCIIVLEEESGLHVATWHAHIDATEFAIVCAAVGLYYNGALLVPEINSAGVAVVETLTKVIGYYPLYRSRIYNRIEADPLGPEWGWRTTPHNRPILISKISMAVNYERLFTRDYELVKELRTMQYDESGMERARGRDKDDRVMALGLALIGRAESLEGSLDTDPPGQKRERLSPDDAAVWDRFATIQDRYQYGMGSDRNRLRTRHR
jgi:hypothetical protein